MDSYNFAEFDKNTTIQEIGQLFRPANGAEWSVNVHCHPNQPLHSFTMSNAPAVVRGRVINAPHGQQRANRRRIVSTSAHYEWYVKRIGTCPIEGFSGRRDADQYCFAFMTKDSTVIYIPQFELARALFFHNSYLSRTALESDCLETEFEIEYAHWDNAAIVRVMPTAGFPLSLLCDHASRKHLSWILLDKDARSSFQSIHWNQIINGENEGHLRHWNFQFDPPPLGKVQFDLHGNYDPHSNTLFVYEIDRIMGLSPDLPARVDYFHPDYAQIINDGRAGGKVHEIGSVGSLTLHNGATARESTQPFVIEAPKVDIEFDRAVVTSIIATREKRVHGANATNEEEQQDLFVSTEESVTNQGMRQATWSITNDISDDSQLLKNKFSCFLQMIDVLIQSYGCDLLDMEIRKLPRLKRCKKYILSTDETPRGMAVICLAVEDKRIHLLEVDTSDGAKALSTQILAVGDSANWETGLIEVEKALIRSSLCWPKCLLAELCGNGHFKGVSHPRTPSIKRGLLDTETIAGWADRAYNLLTTL